MSETAPAASTEVGCISENPEGEENAMGDAAPVVFGSKRRRTSLGDGNPAPERLQHSKHYDFTNLIARATCGKDPMYPGNEYRPLELLDAAKVDVQVRKWLKLSVACLQTIINVRRSSGGGETPEEVYQRMLGFLQQDHIRRELQATYHRLNQLNDYGKFATAQGNLNDVKDNKGLANDVPSRSLDTTMQLDLQLLANICDVEFKKVLEDICDEIFRYCGWVSHDEGAEEQVVKQVIGTKRKWEGEHERRLRY